MVDSTRIPKDSYPFSTQDGRAIPLDTARIRWVAGIVLTDSSVKAFTFDEFDPVILFHCLEPVIAVPAAQSSLPLADGNKYDKGFYIPAGFLATLTVETGTYEFRTLSGTAILYMQSVEKWAGLSTQNNFGAS